MLATLLISWLYFALPQDSGSGKDAVDSLSSGGRFQTELPVNVRGGEGERGEGEGGDGSRGAGRGYGRGRGRELGPRGGRPSESSGDERGLAEVASTFLWILLIGGFVLMLIWLGVQMRGARREREGTLVSKRQTPANHLEDPVPQAPLTAAQELEREGRYGEAAHALLLAAIGLLAGRLDSPLRDFWTAREVLRRCRNDAGIAAPLERIVALAERHLFAGREVEASELAAAWQDFEAIRAATGSAA